MAKLPKWKREFNKRMAAQLRILRKSHDQPNRLTLFTYHNGRVDVVQKRYYRTAWGNRVRDYRRERRQPAYEYVWVPN